MCSAGARHHPRMKNIPAEETHMTDIQSWGEYIDVAILMATYKVLDDDGAYYGEIPGLQGAWANADTLRECREELREVLEGWIELGIVLGHDIPDIWPFPTPATPSYHSICWA